jgi:hypothetical protein
MRMHPGSMIRYQTGEGKVERCIDEDTKHAAFELLSVDETQSNYPGTENMQ